MKVRDILVINSYGGSLLLGAKKLGLPIRGSYEDSGYGISIQKLNFPGLDFRAKTEDWPKKQNLSRTIVIAHPPCAWASTQASNAKVRGTESEKFKPTCTVIEYALKNNCAALAIESVRNAKEGARQVHDGFAKKYRYRIYRVEQNSIQFELAQWRPRFWVIFIKEGRSIPKELTLSLKPKRRTIAQVMKKTGPTVKMKDIIARVMVIYNQQMVLLREKNIPLDQVRRVFNPVEPKHAGSLATILARELGIPRTEAVALCVGGQFTTRMLRVVHPASYASTIMYDTSLICCGRPLTAPEYCDIMGFPRNYKWPKSDRRRFREFLSRGVCPPVAYWILKSIYDHLEGAVPKTNVGVVGDGEEIIFRPSKKDYV